MTSTRPRRTDPVTGEPLESFGDAPNYRRRRVAVVAVGALLLTVGACSVGRATAPEAPAAVQRVEVPGPTRTVQAPAPKPQRVEVEVTPASCISALDTSGIIVRTNADMLAAVGAGDVDALERGSERLSNISDRGDFAADVAACRASAEGDL